MKNIYSFHSSVIIYYFYAPLLHIILSEEFLDKSILLNFCLFRPPLRTHLMNGDFFVGSAIGSTLTKLALRFIELEKDQVKQNVNIHLILPFTIVNCFFPVSSSTDKKKECFAIALPRYRFHSLCCHGLQYACYAVLFGIDCSLNLGRFLIAKLKRMSEIACVTLIS